MPSRNKGGRKAGSKKRAGGVKKGTRSRKRAGAVTKREEATSRGTGFVEEAEAFGARKMASLERAMDRVGTQVKNVADSMLKGRWSYIGLPCSISRVSKAGKKEGYI